MTTQLTTQELGVWADRALARLVSAHPDLDPEEIAVCRRIYRAHLLGIPMTPNA